MWGRTGVASSLTPAPDGAEWSDLRPGRFTSTREPPIPWANPVDGLDGFKVEKYLLQLPGFEPHIFHRVH